jgi:hypothetical protein
MVSYVLTIGAYFDICTILRYVAFPASKRYIQVHKNMSEKQQSTKIYTKIYSYI